MERAALLSITFQTAEFPTQPEGDLVHCNGQPGSKLAEWLRAVLAEQGISAGEPIQEDYGWGIWLAGEISVWVAVSFAGGDQANPTDMPEWCVSVEHDYPFFSLRQWFRRAEGQELCQRVFEVLRRAIVERKCTM